MMKNLRPAALGLAVCLGLGPAAASGAAQAAPKKKKTGSESGPVGPSREELDALKKKPFHATLISKKAAYRVGEDFELALAIHNTRMKNFKVVVPELSYAAVRFEIAYGKGQPFVYGRHIGSDLDPAAARFVRLAIGRAEKARFRLPAIRRGPVRITAIYPTVKGKPCRSNTLTLTVAGGPLAVDVKLYGKPGRIRMHFFPDQAPNTVTHFVQRVKEGFYEGLRFHRVLPGFVAQTGCPLGSGAGGPGYTIKGEFEGRRTHVRGALGMARVGGRNDSNGSQFYICLTTARTAPLDGQYTVFGEVVEGMALVDRIRQGDMMETVALVVPPPAKAPPRDRQKKAPRDRQGAGLRR